MKRVSRLTPKNELRRSLLAQRQAISLSRRAEACRLLKENLSSRGRILSFSSFSTEIDTSLLNAALVATKSLFLPRLENGRLVFYHVEDANHLSLSPYVHPGTPDISLTPYTVVWQCPSQGLYATCTNVSPGAYIKASDCDGNRFCSPKPDQKKEPAPASTLKKTK